MGTQGTGRKRSTKKERTTAEDDALNLIAREAEARLAAKRVARAEAREIRMKELERQQKEIFQVQKKYYGLDNKLDDRSDSKWGDIEQWMEDSERYSRSSRIHTFSDDDERMSVGSRGSVKSDLDVVGAYGGGDSSLLKKSKKKKKHKHKDRDRNGHNDDYSVISSRSSRLSDESRVSRSSRLDLTSSKLSDDSRVSRGSRLDLQPSSLYDDSPCGGSRRVSSSIPHTLEYTSYRSSGSRASSRASSARASPVDNCGGSVSSFLRSAASSSGLPRDLDDVTIPDFSDVEDRDYLEKGSRAASALTAATLTSVGGTSSRRGSGETAITVDAETSIREIKDALTQVEEKYRKAMVSNAQLDNEKNNLMYQVDTLKDSLMELEESLSESRREYEEKAKDFEREKHAHSVLQFQFNEVKETLKQSEELLNKHGIVLGPDLNVNGDIGEAEADGSSTAEPASQPTQETKTTPTEGNSMLGNTEELRSSKEEALNPELQQEKLEEAKENHSNSDTVWEIAHVSPVGTSEKEPLPEEQIRFPLEEEEENSLNKDFNTDTVDYPTIETKVRNICIPEIQVIVTSPEENVPETEMFEGGNVEEINDTHLEETDIKSRADTHSGGKTEISNSLPEKQDNKPKDVEDSDSIKKESCHQQKISHVTTEFALDETVSTISHTELQQEPENPVDAVNNEAEEMPNTSNKGKKKKKKKRGKKKGATHDDTKDQEKGKSEEKPHATPANTDTSTKDTFKESKVDGVMSQHDQQEVKEIDAVVPVEVSASFSQEESKEPDRNPASKEYDNEQAMDRRAFDGVEIALLPEQAFPRSVLDVKDKQNVEQMAETPIVEPGENDVEPLKEPRAGSKKENKEEQSLKSEGINKIETGTSIDQEVNTFVCDFNSSRAFSVDDSDTGDFSNNGEVINPDPEVIVQVEDQVQSVDKMSCECSIYNDLETSVKENSDVTKTSNVLANDPMNVFESKDKTTDDFINGFRCSSAILNSGGDELFVNVSEKALVEGTEAINEDDKPATEPEQDGLPPSVADPCHEWDELESIRGATGRDELNKHKTKPGDPVEPESSSHDGENAPTTKNLEASDKETVVQDEQLQDTETRTLVHMNRVKESGVENMSQSPEPATDISSTNQQETATAKDLEQKNNRHDDGLLPSVCLSTEQLEESTNNKSENVDSSRPTQLVSHEEDNEDEEGQSFDFDDMDVEAAIVSGLPKDPEEGEVEEGVEVKSDESSSACSGQCQVNALSDENTQDKPVDSMAEERRVDGRHRVEPDNEPQEETHREGEEAAGEEEPKPFIDEEKSFSLGELGAVVQNITDTMSTLVEEALDVVKLEWEDKGPDSPNSTDPVASSSKGAEQAGREVKKSGKKGKGKGKEDCKMS